MRCALACFALVVCCAVSARADHKDARLGFTIQTPREWTSIPQRADERWLVANFQSNKPNFWTEKGGWTVEHRPDMQAIAFVDEQIKALAKVTKKTDRQGNQSVLIEFDSPYKDYKDYMQRRYTGGGWYVDKEGETKVGDVRVTTYEIRVDKLSNDGPKRIVTWIYHVPDVDIAIQYECLQDAWPKLQNEVTRCLKSFKQIPRSGEALAQEVTTGVKLNFLEADALSPEERKGWRQSSEQELHERARKNLPDGWQAKKIGRFLVVFHTDEKFARRVAEQAEAVWGWLEDTFGFVGEKEYVRSPIIRICKDREEENQFRKAGSWGWNDLEIVTHQDYGGTTSWEMGYVNQKVMEIWFVDRDRNLYWAMPAWLGNGLREVIQKAKATKGGKVEFKADDWNRDEVRQMVREGKMTPPRELMMLTNSELFSGTGEDFWGAFRQSQALVNFLVTGPAAKNARTRNVLPDYVKSLKAVQDVIKAENDAKKGEKEKKPQTEEEEEALFRAQRDGYKAGEKRILEETWRKAFAGWDDKDWKKFEELYFDAVG